MYSNSKTLLNKIFSKAIHKNYNYCDRNFKLHRNLILETNPSNYNFDKIQHEVESNIWRLVALMFSISKS